MSNEFSTVFFRFGHSMLSSNFRLDNGPGEEDTFVGLKEAFFNQMRFCPLWKRRI